MPRLRDQRFRNRYASGDSDLVQDFYLPALGCATRYDRSTGYFNASALALAARGLERLLRNGGRMRLLVGCTLKPPEIAAIEQGTALRDAVAAGLQAVPLVPPDVEAHAALELLAWMVARDFLSVKV